MEYRLEEMVAQHTGLVKSVALRLSYVYGEDVEDLMQIGYIGLIKAIKGFDESKGFKFSTYAVPMITGEIRSQLRDQGNIKVSRSIKKDIQVIRKVEEMFYAEYGKSPRVSQISELTDFSEERVKQALQAYDAMNNMSDFEDECLIIKEEEKNITRLDIACTLDKLDKTERQVMVLRYYKDMTQNQVAKTLGISQVQVSRIEKKSLKNMALFME